MPMPPRHPETVPEELEAVMTYLETRHGVPAHVTGVLAQSPAALNATAAFENTFTLQTRLAPASRSALRLAVASELGGPSAVAALAARARRDGLGESDVERYLLGGDGTEPDATLVRLVRRLARNERPRSTELDAVQAAGWTAAEVVEAVVTAAHTVSLIWLLPRTAGDAREDGKDPNLPGDQ